jgi:chromosomal replication initiator protein
VLKDALRQHLSRACPEQDLRRWFDPLEVEVIEPIQVFSVEFPHPYFAQWFGQSVQDLFEKEVGHFMGPGYVMQYHCRTVPATGAKGAPFHDLISHIDFPFGHGFTFETYHANEKNFFPVALAREVAKSTEIKYNPFIICGASGTGKTHLLLAIANHISRLNDKQKIFLGTVDDIENIFTVKFPGKTYEARKYLQSFDWLFVDDFQSVRKHLDLQEELILLFNMFYDRKKQMVFCSSERISTFDFLDPTLRSRLEWGLVVHLKEPDLDVRVDYVDTNNRKRKLGLDHDKILVLARRFENIRKLRGILLKIDAYREHMQRDRLTEPEFRRIIRQGDDRRGANLTAEHIVSVTASHFQVEVKDIMGAKRHKNVVMARQTAMTLCRSLLGMSFPALGKFFGGKDHSTVLYSIRKMQSMQTDNEETKKMFQTLSKKCRQLGAA